MGYDGYTCLHNTRNGRLVTAVIDNALLNLIDGRLIEKAAR